MRKGSALVIAGFILVISAVIIPIAADSGNFIFTMTVFVLGIVLIWLGMFERSPVLIEQVVLIALLSALSSAGRILFFGIPSIQPASFIIIAAGIAFGPKMGLMTGVVTAIASNLILGQGPWTPWQMFLWGSMGYGAGVCSAIFIKRKTLRVVYGAAWGFIFGWAMNVWFIAGYSPEISGHAFLAAGIASFYMDAAHAASNAVLLFFAGDRLIRTFHRVAVKYGLSGRPVYHEEET